MIFKTDDKEWVVYECDECGSLTKIKSLARRPDGYHVTIAKLVRGEREDSTPYFCSTKCFKDGIQYHHYA